MTNLGHMKINIYLASVDDFFKEIQVGRNVNTKNSNKYWFDH